MWRHRLVEFGNHIFSIKLHFLYLHIERNFLTTFASIDLTNNTRECYNDHVAIHA